VHSSISVYQKMLHYWLYLSICEKVCYAPFSCPPPTLPACASVDICSRKLQPPAYRLTIKQSAITSAPPSIN